MSKTLYAPILNSSHAKVCRYTIAFLIPGVASKNHPDDTHNDTSLLGDVCNCGFDPDRHESRTSKQVPLTAVNNPAWRLYKRPPRDLAEYPSSCAQPSQPFLVMPSPSIYLRTPDATPGSFVKILWDFTCSTMGSTQPPQYELLKLRITESTSKYWAAVHIPPVNSNQDPMEVSFLGKSMPTPQMAIEAAAHEALVRL